MTVLARMGQSNGQARVYLTAPFILKDTIKTLPNALWDRQLKQWHIPATHFAVAEMHLKLDRHGLKCDPLVDALLDGAKRLELAQSKREADNLPEIPGLYCECTVPLKIDERDLSCDRCKRSFGSMMHQRQAFWFTVDADLDGVMLGMDMGTGKSKVAVALLEHWQLSRVLVICPRNVVGVWPRETRLHGVRQWGAITSDSKGTVTKRMQFAHQQLAAATARGNPFVFVVNYDIVWRPAVSALLKQVEWEAIILDESHRVKAPGGKVSKTLQSVSAPVRKRLALTGTPMPHSPMDLYAQYRVIDPSIFGTSFSRFRNKYAVMGGFEGRQVVGYQNEDELNRRWGSVAFICKAEDVLDLPPISFNERTFDLGPKARRAYDVLDNGIALELENGAMVSVENALTKMLRLQQITSGYIRDDEGDDHVVADDKLKLLEDLLEDFPQGEPIVVFARFKHDLKMIRAMCESQGRKTGELSGNERTALNADAKMRDDIDVAVVQLKSGGVGVDFTRAAVGIYYSLDTSLGDFDQSVKRLHRPGQRRPTRLWFLLANDSKDITLFDALKRRKNLVESFIEAARRRNNYFLQEEVA